MVNSVRARAVSTIALAVAGTLVVASVAPRSVSAAPTAAEVAAGRSRSGSSGLRTGDAAPEIAADRLSGTEGVSLPELRGHVVVIDFWATWCGPCHRIMPDLDRMYQRHQGAGLAVVGIAREPEGRLRAHLAESPVSYTVARDVGGTLTRYGVRALPTIVVIDRAGQVRDVVVGMDGSAMGRLDRLVQTLLAEPAH